MIMNIYILLLVSLNLAVLCKSDCNPVSGPSGSPECIELDGYEGLQWATCLTDVYIRTYSKGKHVCEDSTATYCYYQCMMELHTRKTGEVTDDCKCNMTATTVNLETSTIIPNSCYSPSGDDCFWYRECLEKRYPCKQHGESYAIDYAEKFCNLYDAHATRFDAQGQRWINAVRKCLQVNLVPILRPFVTMSCEEIKQKAFESHPDCYTSPDANAPSICDIGVKNWLSVIMTVKSAFLDAPLDSLRQMTEIGVRCVFSWTESSVQFLKIDFSGRYISDFRLVYKNIVEYLANNRKWSEKGIQYFGYPTPGDESSFPVTILLMPAIEYDFNYNGNISPNITSAVIDAANAVKNGHVVLSLPGNVQAMSFSICDDNSCTSTRMTVGVPTPATSTVRTKMTLRVQTPANSTVNTTVTVGVPTPVNSAVRSDPVNTFMKLLLCATFLFVILGCR